MTLDSHTKDSLKGHLSLFGLLFFALAFHLAPEPLVNYKLSIKKSIVEDVSIPREGSVLDAYSCV